jgi:hypothetical protein
LTSAISLGGARCRERDKGTGKQTKIIWSDREMVTETHRVKKLKDIRVIKKQTKRIAEIE